MIWPTKKLGEICQIRTGKKDVNEGNPEGKYPFFTCSREISHSDVYSFDAEAILVAGNGDVRATKYYKGKFEAYQRTYVLDHFKEGDVRFIYYFILAGLKKKLLQDKSGSTMPYVRKGDLASFEIPLPPLSEQQKIVYVLDSIQEAVGVQDKIIEKTKELKRSLMHKLFREGTRGAKLKKTEIGKIPENWEVVRVTDSLDKKAKFKIGKLKQKEYEKSGKYPIIDQGNENVAGYSNEEAKAYQGKLPIIIFGDHTRVVKFVNFPFIIGGDGVKILIPKEESFDAKFFYYLLLNLKIESRGYNRHFPILKEKLIPLLPFSEQREIAEILQTVDQKIEIEQKKKELYEELFKSMLNQLMTGKIRVDNINL